MNSCFSDGGDRIFSLPQTNWYEFYGYVLREAEKNGVQISCKQLDILVRVIEDYFTKKEQSLV